MCKLSLGQVKQLELSLGYLYPVCYLVYKVDSVRMW